MAKAVISMRTTFLIFQKQHGSLIATTNGNDPCFQLLCDFCNGIVLWSPEVTAQKLHPHHSKQNQLPALSTKLDQKIKPLALHSPNRFRFDSPSGSRELSKINFPYINTLSPSSPREAWFSLTSARTVLPKKC